MSINKELNENEAINAYGGNIKTQDLPEKFKSTGGAFIDINGEIVRDPNYKSKIDMNENIPTFNPPGELNEDGLENVYGGPIKADDLPDTFFKGK
jgi:hypothetical protein